MVDDRHVRGDLRRRGERSMAAETRRITGRVLDEEQPAAGVLVSLVQRELRREAVLVEAPTDADGAFALDVPVTGTELLDAVLRVHTAPGGDGEPLAEQPVGLDTALDVTILVAGPDRSAFERLRTRITPLLAGQGAGGEPLPAGDLGPDDIARISAALRADPAEVRAWALASAAVQDGPRGIGETLYYAWFRSRPQASLAEVLQVPAEQLVEDARRSSARSVIPPVPEPDLARAARALVAFQARQALEQRAADEPAGLGDLLATIPPERAPAPGTRAAMARLSVRFPDFGPGFWAALPAAGLDPAQVASVRSTVRLAELCDGDRTLVATLQPRLGEPDGSLAALARLAPNDWIETAAQARPDVGLEAVEGLARTLSDRIAAQHPTPALLSRLTREPPLTGYPVAVVSQFLERFPDFDVRTTPVEAYLTEHGVADDEDLRSGLLGTQRMLMIGATQDEAIAMVGAGITSSQRLVALRGDALAAVLAGRADDERVRALQSRALQLSTATLGLATVLMPELAGDELAAFKDPGVYQRHLDLAARLPGLAGIFGEDSSRACSHCGSVLAPAAYLVDLLQELTRAGVEPELRARRPDLAHLELTCDNTNTEMPYVDSVLEVLESATVFPLGPVPLTAAEQDELDAGTLPTSLRTELARTVSALDDDLLVQGATAGTGVQDVAVVQGHRRWIVRRSTERIDVGRGDWPGVGTVEADLTVADRDAARDGLRAGAVTPALLALLAPEPQLPVAGPVTVTRRRARLAHWAHGPETYRVAVDRQITVALIYQPASGWVILRRADGTEVTRQPVPAFVIPGLAAGLGAGTLPAYLANQLPRGTYEVRDGGPVANALEMGQWVVSGQFLFTVTYDPGEVSVDGLVFTGSSQRDDLTSFAENRDPEAYRILSAACFPWSLPFQGPVHEIRACLATIGVSRRDLLRAVRPTIPGTAADTAEILGTTPAQLDQLSGPPPAAGPAGFWGLAAAGNAVAEPSGDPGATPVPGDWTGALTRLSVLLERAGVGLPVLLEALAGQYVGADARLQPAGESRPGRIDVAGLDADVLQRLHRFLRLHRITGWPIRDLDTVLAAVAARPNAPLAQDELAALAAAGELATRLGVGLRTAALWLGTISTRPYTDREAAGEPAHPGQYDEIFTAGRPGHVPDPDFALDAVGGELRYLTDQVTAGVVPPVPTSLTAKAAELGRAVQLRPAELDLLLGARPVLLTDELTLANLGRLVQHLSLARALGLDVRGYLALRQLASDGPFAAPGQPAIPAPERARRIRDLCDLVDELRAGGLTPAAAARLAGLAEPDAASARARALELGGAVGELQAGLRAAAPAATGIPDVDLAAALAAAGWAAGPVERMLHGDLGLDSDLAVEVTVASGPLPALPAALPFTTGTLEPGVQALRADLPRLAALDADAAFTALAALPGLGPLDDPDAPARRLRAVWDALEGRLAAFVPWLQSAQLPVFRAVLDLPAPAAPELNASGSRLRYDRARGELVLSGYLDAAEQARFSGLSDRPGYAAVVTALAASARAFQERRPGSRLLSADAARLLMLTESPSRRFELVLDALRAPLRRLRLAELVSARFGIDPVLFQTFDDAARLAGTSRDILAAWCSDGFVAADLTTGPIPAAWLEPADRLDRTGSALAAIGARPEEAAWFTVATGFTGLATLGWAAPDPAPRTAFAGLRAGLRLARLRTTLPGGAALLESVRAAAAQAGAAVQDALDPFVRAWALPGDATDALTLDGAIGAPADLLDPLRLGRVCDVAILLRRLRITAAVLLQLAAPVPGDDAAVAARSLFGTGSAAAASAGLREAMNAFRERQRQALVDHLVHRDGAVDSADLHARYLLDVEMGPLVRTSRVKQAISSVQLFIQRWLLRLEPDDLPRPPADLIHGWEWMRSYRVWEANRKVFLYPENWLEPALRDDKSHLFTAFESTLLQTEVTSARAVEAVRQYLDGLDELSKVTVVAMYRETTGPRAGTIHVVGRTPHRPVKYFYRQWHAGEAAGSWDPWEPLEVVGNTDHVVVFVRNGRPAVAWLDIGDAPPGDFPDDRPSGAAGQTPSWAAQLLWSRRDQAGWVAPRRSARKIVHQKAINKDARTTFALRVEPAGPDGPQVRCFAGTDDGAMPRPDPVPWPSGSRIARQPRPAGAAPSPGTVQVQVLGRWNDRTFGLADAKVEIWFLIPGWPGALPPELGSPARPLSVRPDRDGIARLSIPAMGSVVIFPLRNVNVRVTWGSRPPEPVVTEWFSPVDVNDIRFGFLLDLTGTTPPPADPRRRLHLFSIATGRWGPASGLQWDQEDLGTPVLATQGLAEHVDSGYRFPINADVSLFGDRLGNPVAVDDEVFVSATASDASPGLGPPYYLEAETGAAGFVLPGVSGGPFTYLPATEVAHYDVARVLDGDPETLSLPAAADAVTAVAIHPLSLDPSIARPYDPAAPALDRALPYAGYDWEVFFHAPLMIARGLAAHHRYGEALRWLQVVFEPRTTAVDGAGRPAWWRFPPFAAAGPGRSIDLLLADWSAGRLSAEQQALLGRQLRFSRESPFRPDGIARMRVRAYQWMTVLSYVEVLIGWGDQEFRRDTIESINEATQLYLLAAQLLGRPPVQLPAAAPLLGPPTYAGLGRRWDDFGNAWVSMADTPMFAALLAFLEWLLEHGVVSPGSGPYEAYQEQVRALASIGSLAFCVPGNDRIPELRDRVADRLLKIRQSRNLDGVQRQLALFEPPIDPALLVQAVAAGLDPGALLAEAAVSPAPYRFSVALQLADQFCTELAGLGGGLLAALEKRDAEELTALHSGQELALMALAGDVRRRQLDAAVANEEALRSSRQTVAVRYQHYQRLLGKGQIRVPGEQDPIPPEPSRLQPLAGGAERMDPDLQGYGLTREEADQLGWLATGNTFTIVGSSLQLAGSILHMVPDFTIGSPFAGSTFGGSNLGDALGALGQFFGILAGNANFQANRSSIVAGHQRRYDEWVLQANLAGAELAQLDRQLLVARIQTDIARRELAQHELQARQAAETDEFIRGKFTSAQLYGWTAERLSGLHTTAYHLAHDLARRAEQAFAFELGVPPPAIIGATAWDTRRRGLLAGEQLSLDLRRLQAAYAEGHRRELEITKSVSLLQVDPLALVQLQTTGVCEFSVPELLYDLDFPGHYYRRIRSVSLSVPGVTGPYTGVPGTLTLLENRLRASAAPAAAGRDADFRSDLVPIQSVATSTGVADTGMFEFGGQDDRYAWFEGAGAISRWRFELPTAVRAFDYRSISDLVLQIRYTARDGGEPLRADAIARQRAVFRAENEKVAAAGAEGLLVRAADLGQDYPAEWAAVTAGAGADADLTIGVERFPFGVRDQRLELWKVSLFLRGEDAALGPDPSLTLTPAASSYRGAAAAPPPLTWTALGGPAGTALYEAALDDADWAPLPVATGVPGRMRLGRRAGAPPPRDAVLAFWWRLAAG